MTRRDAALNGALALAALALVFGNCLVGPAALSASEAFAALIGGGVAGDRIVVWEIRAPRAAAAFLAGAALGLSGAALQGLLRNPLAEPGVLGVSASAALAATSALYFGLGAVSAWVVPSAAIAGALGATLFLAAAAARAVSTIGLVLIGVGLSSFAGALMALLLNLAPNPFSLADLVSWVLGSVANRGIGDVALAAPFMALGAVCLLASHRGLVALTLGEDGANAIGADVARTRTLVVIGAGLLTGASVALGGVIGFVGIVAPHLVRGLVVHDAGRVLIPSALLAGALLCAADLIVRLSATQQELKLGAVAALIGAPAFVWIALRARGDA